MLLIPKPKTIFITIFLIVSYTIISHVQSSSDQTQKPINKMVQRICTHTSNYSFCVKALYTDNRTQDADLETLAVIALGMAYNNANVTQGLIGKLLKRAASMPGGWRKGVERCGDDYAKAAIEFALAYNDLYAETYFELGYFAGVASRAVDDCRDAFGGSHEPPLLEGQNRDTKGFCEMVVVIGKLLPATSIELQCRRLCCVLFVLQTTDLWVV